MLPVLRARLWRLGLSAALVLVGACSNQPSASLPAGITTADLPIVMADPLTGNYTQVIDHHSDVGTFQQRYWYSTQFVSGPKAPVIFYFCGEAPCSAKYAQSMADTAKTLGAAVLALEHRYYGKSLPYANPTLDQMQYLTIDNALEDAAAFETWAKANLLLPSGKWLAVGGSYPGMLAAFYREKHPEMVAGAWASSAPVNVQLSFAGYDMTATRALGSECVTLFKEATNAAEAQYDAGKGEDLLKQLMGKDYMPSLSKADFMSDIAGEAMEAAQYGNQNAFCAALSQDLTPYQGMIDYANPPLEGNLGNGLTPTQQELDPEMQLASFGRPFLNLPPDGTTTPPIDAWLYQVCTEVGFYQVHNPQSTDSIMSPLVDEDYYNAVCDHFIKKRPNVQKTNDTYYAPLAQGKVTNVLFVNGEYDPWSVLSFVDGGAPAGLTTFVVSHGSHCSDLTNLKAGMLLGDYEVHVKVHDLATQWLAN